MTEAFNDAIRGTLASRKTGISKKKPADPDALAQQASDALEALQAAVAGLAELAAESREEG